MKSTGETECHVCVLYQTQTEYLFSHNIPLLIIYIKRSITSY